MTRIYVGNLAATVCRADLELHFGKVGEVSGALVILDPSSKKSRGFGFVEMVDAEAARYAANALNDSELKGQKIRIEAMPGHKASVRSRRSR